MFIPVYMLSNFYFHYSCQNCSQIYMYIFIYMITFPFTKPALAGFSWAMICTTWTCIRIFLVNLYELMRKFTCTATQLVFSRREKGMVSLCTRVQVYELSFVSKCELVVVVRLIVSSVYPGAPVSLVAGRVGLPGKGKRPRERGERKGNGAKTKWPAAKRTPKSSAKE
jgi:hypothetical protein